MRGTGEIDLSTTFAADCRLAGGELNAVAAVSAGGVTMLIIDDNHGDLCVAPLVRDKLGAPLADGARLVVTAVGFGKVVRAMPKHDDSINARHVMAGDVAVERFGMETIRIFDGILHKIDHFNIKVGQAKEDVAGLVDDFRRFTNANFIGVAIHNDGDMESRRLWVAVLMDAHQFAKIDHWNGCGAWNCR